MHDARDRGCGFLGVKAPALDRCADATLAAAGGGGIGSPQIAGIIGFPQDTDLFEQLGAPRELTER